MQTFVAILVLFPNDFGTLVNYFSFSMWIFHGSSAAALLVLRRTQPNRHRPYKVRAPLVVKVIKLRIKTTKRLDRFFRYTNFVQNIERYLFIK